MFKKLGSLLGLIFLLAACQTANELQPQEVEAPTLEQPADSDLATASLEIVPYLTRYEETVLLINLATGETLASHVLPEENGWVEEVFDFNNGNFAALVGVSGDVHLSMRGEIDTEEVDWDNDAHDHQLRFLIFDQELNVLEEFPIDEQKFSDNGHYISLGSITRNVATFENDELVLYFSPNVFTGVSEYSIQRYNVHTGEFMVIVQGIDTQIMELEKTTNPQYLFFTGRNGGPGIGDPSTIYGTINIETGEINTESTQGFWDLVQTVDDSYAVLVAGGGWDGLRGKVMILNLATLEYDVMQLEDDVQDWLVQRLSYDQKHIVTLNDEQTYFRKYEIESGDLITEVAVESDFGDVWGNFINIFPITESIYSIHTINSFSGYQEIRAIITLP